jgi:hypothetical protein
METSSDMIATPGEIEAFRLLFTVLLRRPGEAGISDGGSGVDGGAEVLVIIFRNSSKSRVPL